MEELLNFKKELQEHQDVNRSMVKWAKENKDNKNVENWKNKVVECDYILFLIDNFIKEEKNQNGEI